MFSKTQAYFARLSFSFFAAYLKILLYSLRKVLRIQAGSFGRPLVSTIPERNADTQQIKTTTTRRTTATCHPNDSHSLGIQNIFSYHVITTDLNLAVIILYEANLTGVSQFIYMNF